MRYSRSALAIIGVCAAVGAFLPLSGGAATISRDGVWREAPAAAAVAGTAVATNPARVYTLNKSKIAGILTRAGKEGTLSKAVVILPLPDGTYVSLRVEKSPVLSAALGKLNPGIATFVGRGVTDKRITARLDLTPAGFHGQIFTPSGTAYIDPVGPPRVVLYRSAWGGSVSGSGFACAADAPALPQGVSLAPAATSGAKLRTYRLVVTATSDYTAFLATLVPPVDPTAAITTTVNRLNGIFEREAGIRFEIVAPPNIYTDAATDPFVGGIINDTILEQHQVVLDAKYTTAGYDIGHLFTSGPAAGLSSLGSACDPLLKARGGSALPTPTGDAFDVDIVAHQIGHQLGARHTFNGTAGACGSERIADNAFELGSGSTLMSLAGSCDTDDIQPSKDAYLHTASFDEIIAFRDDPLKSACGMAATVTNASPAVVAGPGVTIPRGTPFTLTAASGSDPDPLDQLTFCWEQFDLDDPLNAVPAPLFRSRPPVAEASRTFPAFADLLANPVGPWAWESLPAADRAMTFRVTARDNRTDGGGVSYDTLVVTVAGDPFAITAPVAGVALECGAPDELLWDVGGGGVATMVRPLVSRNGGVNFNPLTPDTDNDGSVPFTVPQDLITNAWIKLEAVGNVFFSLAGPFTVVDTLPPVVTPPPDITAECTSPAGTIVVIGVATATDLCDSTLTVSNNAPSLFPLGMTPVLWSSTDDSGNPGSATQEVTVVDTTPPRIAVAVSPSRIWPPNHKLVTIRATVTVRDICDAAPAVRLVSITSNEPENGKGDGNTNGDVQGADFGRDDREFQVRAERSGNGDGRIYTVTYEAKDATGNVGYAQAQITVPHDMR
jgi:hypothetical protein